MGDWADRYATMDFPSEAAIAGEIGKFLLNGALYPRPAAGDVVAGREDRAGRGRDRVPRPHQHHDLGALPGGRRRRCRSSQGAAVVIWTTTPWTMPGNRADRLRGGVRLRRGAGRCGRRRARSPAPARSWWWRCRCCRQTCDGGRHRDPPCAARAQGRGDSPARSAPTRCAAAATTTTCRCCSATSSPPRPAPASSTSPPAMARTISILGRAHGIEVPDTVGDDGTFNAWVPLFAGLHVYKAADPVCAALDRGRRAAGARQAGALLSAFLALQGAADLPRHAAMVHPHGWRRSTSARRRWRPSRRPHFVPEKGRNRLGQHDRRAAGLVHQPPARLGRADRGVRRASDRRAAARSRRWSRASSRPSATEGADAWYASPPERFLGPGRDPGRLRAGDGHRRCVVRVRLDPCLRAGGPAPALAGRPLSRRAPTSIAAGSIPRCWNRSARAGGRRSRRC